MTQQNATVVVWDRVGPMTPKFEIGREFCTTHLATTFYHPMFNRSEVIVLTDKQTHKQTNKTPLKTSTSVRYVTPVDKNTDPKCTQVIR